MLECKQVSIDGSPLFLASATSGLSYGDEVSLEVSTPASINGKYIITTIIKEFDGVDMQLQSLGSSIYTALSVTLMNIRADRTQRWRAQQQGNKKEASSVQLLAYYANDGIVGE